MKRILLVLSLAIYSLSSSAKGFDASYNISIMSYANVQLTARDIFQGFGLYVNARGLNNGTNIESQPIYNKISLLQPTYSVDITHDEIDSETRRSGISFGINKTFLRHFFIGASAGYCDVVKYQKTILKPYTMVSGVKTYEPETYNFSDQSSVRRKFEYEILIGATPQWERFYVPVYVGWSYNYTGFFGIGFGYKL